MALLDIPLSLISEGDLSNLIVTKTPESLLIDYKRESYESKEADRTEFLKDVSSFANTRGGDLIIGIDEIDRLPTQITPFIGSVDIEFRRFQDWARTGLEPRLPSLDMHAVPIASGGHILIIRARQSYLRPHGVVFGGRTQFCARHQLGRYEPNVAQLRGLFTEGSELARQIREFRMDRLVNIQAGSNPAGLGPGAKLVVHVASMDAFADGRFADIVDLIMRGTHVPLPPSGLARNNRPAVNLDGYLAVMHEIPGGYAQFFRSGTIEGVLELPSDGDNRFLPGINFGNIAVTAAKQYIDVLTAYGAGESYVLMLTICEAAGARLRYGMRHANSGYSLSEPCSVDMIATPDIVLKASVDNVAMHLRPAFNMIWNAFGIHPCDLYNQAGKWIGTA